MMAGQPLWAIWSELNGRFLKTIRCQLSQFGNLKLVATKWVVVSECAHGVGCLFIIAVTSFLDSVDVSV